MPDTIKLPILGPTKKPMAIALGVGAAVVIGVAIYRYRQAQANSTVTTTDAQIDPATGYAYGSAEDAAALAADSAYQNPVSYGGGGGPGTGTVNYGGTDTGTFQPATNDEWGRYVEQYLNDAGGGGSETQILSAIGKYLNGGSLTSTEADIVNQAIAIGGKPPVAGLNGFPPSMHIQSATEPPQTAMKQLAKPTIRLVSKGKGTAVITWTAIPNVQRYLLHQLGGPIVVHTAAGNTVSVKSPGEYWVYATANGYRDSPASNHIKV